MRAVLSVEAAEAGLEKVLEERELRARIAACWQKKGASFLSMGLNLAGAQKRGHLADRFFLFHLDRLRERLLAQGAEIAAELIRQNAAGAYWLASVEKMSAPAIKRICLEEEEGTEAGRLLDLDVQDESAVKLERSAFGYPPRRCLLCQEEAFFCARSRRHPLAELQGKSQRLMRAELLYAESRRLAETAAKAALFEALAGPKPGLVDRFDSGSHQDMDIFSFAETSLLLRRFAAEAGELTVREILAGNPLGPKFLEQLAALGREAERRSFAAVSANTQNGLIFALGLVIPALLSLADGQEKNCFSTAFPRYAGESLGRWVRSFYTPFYERDRAARLPLEGARESAINGYRNVFMSALPYLREKLAGGLIFEDALLMTLLRLICEQTDRNLLRKGGKQCADELKLQAGKLLAELEERLRAESPETFSEQLHARIREFSSCFESAALSPGGSADLLALCLFFYFLGLE